MYGWRRLVVSGLRLATVSACCFIMGGLGLASHGNGTEIRASVALPASHPVVAAGWDIFQRAVASAERPDLRFRLFVNGALFGSERALKALSQGEAEMGFIAPADHPEEFPNAAFLAALSMIGKDGPAAAAALTELVLVHCRPCRDEFAVRNLVFLGTYSAAPYMLIGKQPLADARSLAGQHVWTPGSHWDSFLREIAAEPVRTGRDSAEALGRMGADAVIDVSMSLQQPSFAKHAKAVTLLPLGAYRGASPFTLNRDFWRKLNPEQRAALLAAAPAGLVAATYAYEERASQALEAARDRGVQLVPPDESLVSRLDSAGQRSIARLAGAAGTRPESADAAEMARTYGDLYAKYARLLERSDFAESVAVLEREIFAKLDPRSYGLEEESVADQVEPVGDMLQ